MRKLTWIVISNKRMNTVGVVVKRFVMNKIYKKRYEISKKYNAHTTADLVEGQKVIIVETKPISKTKSWKVLEVIV